MKEILNHEATVCSDVNKADFINNKLGKLLQIKGDKMVKTTQE